MHEVTSACVIMHNMIIKQEHHDSLHDQGWKFQDELVEPQAGATTFQEFIHMQTKLCDSHISARLQANIIEHEWILARHEEKEE
jgi:hypothetical protein